MTWNTVNTAQLISESVLEIGDGYRAKNAEFRDQGGLPFVRVKDVGSRISTESLDELPRALISKYDPKVSRPGDSLITMKGTVGRVAFVTEMTRQFVYSPQISYWRSHDTNVLHPRWVSYWLQGPEFAYQASATKGSTDMADYINLRDQRRMKISLPPISIQRRVAEILGSIDDLIENNRRRIEVLEEMAQAIYREWFVHFRFPGHEDATFVDSPLGPIPDGWEATTLGDCSLNFDRLRKPLSRMERAVRPGPYPYYGAAKLIDWVDDWIFDGEYLLFAEDGSVQTTDGYPVLQLIDCKFWPNNHTHILQGSGVSTRFLYLSSKRQPIGAFVTGAAQPKITQKNLKRVPIVRPSETTLAEFDAVVDPIMDEWRTLQRESAPLATMRDLLLPKLVTGEVDVSQLDLNALVEAAS